MRFERTLYVSECLEPALKENNVEQEHNFLKSSAIKLLYQRCVEKLSVKSFSQNVYYNIKV